MRNKQEIADKVKIINHMAFIGPIDRVVASEKYCIEGADFVKIMADLFRMIRVYSKRFNDDGVIRFSFDSFNRVLSD